MVRLVYLEECVEISKNLTLASIKKGDWVSSGSLVIMF